VCNYDLPSALEIGGLLGYDYALYNLLFTYLHRYGNKQKNECTVHIEV